jgi:hypothetical protein
MGVAFLLCSPSLAGNANHRGSVDVCRAKFSTARLAPRQHPSRRALVCKSEGPVYDEDDDGGDGFFGGTRADIQASLGISVPDLTLDEREYLATAKDDFDRMDRLRELARKRKALQGPRSMNRNLSSADDYIASLSKKTPAKELASSGKDARRQNKGKRPRTERTEPGNEILDMKRKGMNPGDRYIDDLSQATMSLKGSARPVDETSNVDLDEVDETVSEIDRLRTKIGNLADRMDKDELTDPGDPVHPPFATTTIDKQIQFLEEHLAKLKEEDAVSRSQPPAARPESGPDRSAVRSQVEFLGQQVDVERKLSASGPSSPGLAQGWGDGPGEMSEMEKLAAFDEIRRRNADLRNAEPADPLAVSLPEKRNISGRDGQQLEYDEIDGPGELSEEEIQAKFDSLRKSTREMLSSRAAPARKLEDDFRLALIALRIEHDRYSQEIKRSQQEHQDNIRDIFNRYVPELD